MIKTWFFFKKLCIDLRYESWHIIVNLSIKVMVCVYDGTQKSNFYSPKKHWKEIRSDRIISNCLTYVWHCYIYIMSWNNVLIISRVWSHNILNDWMFQNTHLCFVSIVWNFVCEKSKSYHLFTCATGRIFQVILIPFVWKY